MVHLKQWLGFDRGEWQAMYSLQKCAHILFEAFVSPVVELCHCLQSNLFQTLVYLLCLCTGGGCNCLHPTCENKVYARLQIPLITPRPGTHPMGGEGVNFIIR